MLRKRKFLHSAPVKGMWKYLLEVSLIILSILLAFQMDRWNQKRKNNIKLRQYLTAVHDDLVVEQGGNKNNLGDCLDDIARIETAQRLCRINQIDSLNRSLHNLSIVLGRGVFRSFPPTTFDIMTRNGDVALIEDLALRKSLASCFSFRESYVKGDLIEFNRATVDVTKYLGNYLNLQCFTGEDDLHDCLIDSKGYIQDPHNELTMLWRMARIRAFHLQGAIGIFDRVIKELEPLIEKSQASQ